MVRRFCDCCGNDITRGFGFEITLPDGSDVTVRNGEIQGISVGDDITLDLCMDCLGKLWGGILHRPINYFRANNKHLIEFESI